MYHERTYAEIARTRRNRIIGVIIVALLCAVLVLSSFAARDVLRKQGATSVRESILEAATQCAAVEGSYPSTLFHLEQYYGLSINRDDYVINYEWLADNIPPSVTVVAR